MPMAAKYTKKIVFYLHDYQKKFLIIAIVNVSDNSEQYQDLQQTSMFYSLICLLDSHSSAIIPQIINNSYILINNNQFNGNLQVHSMLPSAHNILCYFLKCRGHSKLSKAHTECFNFFIFSLHTEKYYIIEPHFLNLLKADLILNPSPPILCLIMWKLKWITCNEQPIFRVHV